MTDCLLIGYNDYRFAEHVGMVRSMGVDSGAYRDLRLAYVDYEGRSYRSMDILDHLHHEGRDRREPFSNTDFLWPTILYLGTYLHRRGFTFDYINQFQLEQDLLKEKLLAGDVRTVGITTTLYVTAHPIVEIIDFIRKVNEKVKIIVGGPYIANQAEMMDPGELERLFKFIGADFYVINQEGEKALVDILTALKNGGDGEDIGSVAVRKGGTYKVNPSVPEGNPLAENMVDYRLFHDRGIGRFVSLRTAKSCPFACAFCGFPQRAGKYTYIDTGLVEKELNALADLGTVTTITFLDDTFNVPKPRFREILRMMIRNRFAFKWNSFYRSDHGDDQTIELMAEAGCEGVFLGVESGSDEILSRMNKRSRRRHYLKAIQHFRQVGISTYASIIIGFPGETLETAEESVSLVEEARPDYFRAQLWYCDPMTPVWSRRQEEGLAGSAFNWSHRTMDYQTACDLIDRMFLTIDHSLWMPQYGFEQWSTFYLQRRGMSVEQVKGFIRTFNAAVRTQLIHPRHRTIPSDLLASLKAYCQFDRVHPPFPEGSEPPSADRYLAAERFWLRQLGEGADERIWDLPQGGREVRTVSETLRLDREWISRLERRFESTPDEIVLAAYYLLLSRIAVFDEARLLGVWRHGSGAQLLLLGLRFSGDQSMRQVVQEVASKKRTALAHADYCGHVLGNPLIWHKHSVAPPVFEIGFCYGRPDGGTGLLPGEHRLPIARDVGLVLEVTPEKDACQIELASTRGWFEPEEIAEMTDHLARILSASAEDPDARLDQIALEGGGSDVAVEDDSLEVFQF